MDTDKNQGKEQLTLIITVSPSIDLAHIYLEIDSCIHINHFLDPYHGKVQ